MKKCTRMEYAGNSERVWPSAEPNSRLQHAATCCNTLQYAATHYNTWHALPNNRLWWYFEIYCRILCAPTHTLYARTHMRTKKEHIGCASEIFSMCVIWWGIPHANVRNGTITRMMWIVHMWHMTPSYVLQSSFRRVIRCIHIYEITHSQAGHALFICITCIMCMFDLTHLYVCVSCFVFFDPMVRNRLPRVWPDGEKSPPTWPLVVCPCTCVSCAINGSEARSPFQRLLSMFPYGLASSQGLINYQGSCVLENTVCHTHMT